MPRFRNCRRTNGSFFDLNVHEEMRYEEIAQVLDISTGTVMSRLFRARQKLKAMMKDFI